MNKPVLRAISLLLVGTLLVGCSSSGRHAPVVERGAARKAASAGAQRDQDGRPQVYVIAKGDTLYSIAFNYGLDYREIAELNNIQNPDVIHIGQEIRLFPANTASATQESRADTEIKSGPDETPSPTIPSQTVLVKEWPKAVKLNYSEQALAQIEKMQGERPRTAPVTVARSDTVSSPREPEGMLEWGLPTKGKLISEFSESANRKGIDIGGKLGQAVVASAAGKVVYSGSGLRGYGKLVIIKHNKDYLSAYAHNDQILVKEGQSVSKGQQIAAMGNTDADQVKLHFEIRKLGKPVDPAKYLPL